MTLSDRLSLLSLVTLIWVAFVSISVFLALAEDSPEPADPFGEPYWFTPAAFAFIGLLLLAWFGSWGLISVAILGRGTTVRGWSLRTGLGDVLLFVFGPFVWMIAIGTAAFESYLVSLVILGILPAAILVGLVNLLWRAWEAVVSG